MEAEVLYKRNEDNEEIMKDPTKQLQEAYFTLLNGSVVVSGTEIPVFKWLKPGDTTRITIGEVVMDDNSTHDTFMVDARQSVYVMTELSYGDEREVAADICDEVVQLVVPDLSSGLMTMTDFQMVDSYLDSVELFDEENQDSTVYTKELIFKHLIAEK